MHNQNQNQNQNQEKAASRFEKALAKEKEAQEKAASRMAELEKEIAKLKAEKAESKKREKATKEELSSLKKTLNSKMGEIDILARAMIEASEKYPHGWSKKNLLALYLEKLGIPETDERAILKEATLSAQCGARIAPRLEKLGYQLRRAESDMKSALYLCKPMKKS